MFTPNILIQKSLKICYILLFMMCYQYRKSGYVNRFFPWLSSLNLSVVIAKCWFVGFVLWDRTFICSLYRNPDLDDQIFDCFLTSMAAVQAEDVRATFLFVGDLNVHHQEWLASLTTNHHGVAAFDFANVLGWDQLVIGPTWWNTWPPDDWYSWLSTGWCCSTDR